MPITKQTIRRWGLIYALPGIVIIFFIMAWLLGRSGATPAGFSPKLNADIRTTKVISPTKVLSNTTSNPATDKTASDIPTGIVLPPIHSDLSESSDPALRQLAVYEKSAGGALAGGMMLFTETPTTVGGAQASAREMAGRIFNFAKFDLKPVVIMEPTNSGNTLNFTSYRNGAYDSALNAYFNTLKNFGVTDKSIGMWVYFPEANMPEWGPVDLANYSANVTRTIQIQKNYFPTSLSSIMLDAESYPAGSTDWGNGSYVSLAPFLNGIPTGLVDSFGLQGFPWAPPSNQGGDVSYNPAVYLNSGIAKDAANRLGTSSVWLNTGTFSAMYTKNKLQTLNMNPAQRQGLLNGVLSQATKLKQAGLSVSINLFSEDKSSTSEAINWAYQSTEEKAVLNNFALQLSTGGIELWLFSG